MSTVKFKDTADFERRFSELAEASSDYRTYWRSGEGEGRLGAFLDRLELRQQVRWGLLGDALGVAVFLVSPHEYAVPSVNERLANQLLSSRLAAAISDLRYE